MCDKLLLKRENPQIGCGFQLHIQLFQVSFLHLFCKLYFNTRPNWKSQELLFEYFSHFLFYLEVSSMRERYYMVFTLWQHSHHGHYIVWQMQPLNLPLCYEVGIQGSVETKSMHFQHFRNDPCSALVHILLTGPRCFAGTCH